jgi:hypothetical protein
MRQCIQKSTSSLTARSLQKTAPATNIVQHTFRKHLAAPTILLARNSTNTTITSHRRAFTTTPRMSAIQSNVEAASAEYSASFDKGHLALPPAKKYLVVTCMDARIDPARAFGIELGDAHVIRNVSVSLSSE